MTRIRNSDLQSAIDWLDTYEATSDTDEFGNSLARVTKWLTTEMANREENALIAKMAYRRKVSKSTARRALRIAQEKRKKSSAPASPD